MCTPKVRMRMQGPSRCKFEAGKTTYGPLLIRQRRMTRMARLANVLSEDTQKKQVQQKNAICCTVLTWPNPHLSTNKRKQLDISHIQDQSVLRQQTVCMKLIDGSWTPLLPWSDLGHCFNTRQTTSPFRSTASISMVRNLLRVQNLAGTSHTLEHTYALQKLGRHKDVWNPDTTWHNKVQALSIQLPLMINKVQVRIRRGWAGSETTAFSLGLPWAHEE